jgi:hypothetical protein
MELAANAFALKADAYISMNLLFKEQTLPSPRSTSKQHTYYVLTIFSQHVES